ncbi:hypothetical protein IW139_004622, partial [Coemansia sp. RSA 353]
MSGDTSSEMTQLLSALSLDGKPVAESRQINGSVFEFFLPELVNTLVATTVETKRAAERLALGLETEPEDTAKQIEDVGNAEADSSAGWVELPDDSELMEQVFVKLEAVGFRVGRRLAERFAPLNRRL